jgi:aerobic-type carbon monoxide dehydrogenase small subunit (CoxS/CutS family)
VTLASGRVGESPNRVGGIGRVTGATRYLADLEVADALHAALVTLDVARARIDAIDASEALALPGVHLVLTADELPQPVPRFGPQREDRPVLAVGETHYHGEPVALVVAESRDVAQRAAGLVRVEHEPLPAVVTVADALADGAEVVTVEGLAARDGTLAPIQQAFLDTGAVQCGFCIPGQLMSAHALLATDAHPDRAAIEEGLAGNLCRCACYEQIFEAVELVSTGGDAGHGGHAASPAAHAQAAAAGARLGAKNNDQGLDQ